MRLLLPFLYFFCLNSWGAELQLPALSSPVMDLAGFLDEAAKRDLAELAYEIKANNGPQITLLTVPDLQGQAIEDFSIKVAEKWQLGSKEKDDGLLILISKEERQMRIEVGNGIEGEITDYDTSKYTREIFPRYFRNGDFHGGIRAFMEDVAGRFNVKLSTGENRYVRRSSVRHGGGNGFFLPVILGILVFGSLIFRKRPVARGLFTGVGLGAFSGIMGFPLMMIIGVFVFGGIVGLIGLGNFLTAMAMSGGARGGGFGGRGSGGWSGGGGGFSGGGSSGSW